MRFDTVNAPISELAQRAAIPNRTSLCLHCLDGLRPTKLKRQWVHHDPQTGRLIVCTAHDLKPGS